MTRDTVSGFLRWVTQPEGGLEGGLEAMPGESSLLEGIEAVPGATEPELELAREAVDRMSRNEPLTEPQEGALEAIILPNERPVIDVVDDGYEAPGQPFSRFDDDDVRERLRAAFPSIGRIELAGDPLGREYGGTGFVVGRNLLMTNRHVAELFATGVGREELSFLPGRRVGIDFQRERDSDDSKPFAIARMVMLHPYWDMALLDVEGLEQVNPLTLSVVAPGDLRQREIAVVGYPGANPFGNVPLQDRIFRKMYGIKRLQPGLVRDPLMIESFKHDVVALTHDSSTLGGNSGSAMIDIETGAAVGLHFAGIYLKANYAVATHDLALDRRVVEAGVNFEDEILGDAPAWSNYWDTADPARDERAAPRPAASAASVTPTVTSTGALSFTIPLEIAIEIRSPTGAKVEAPGALEAAETAADLAGRPGYDADFLGIPVPLPELLDETHVAPVSGGGPLLAYEHFSIVMEKDRRLALFTASNVDMAPARKHDLDRKQLGEPSSWLLDPRIDKRHQLPDRFFTQDRGAFDRGHIVRREDVEWGDTLEELRRANRDSYHVTNCSPQIAAFNQSRRGGVWGLLENLILAQADGGRYCLLAGPVFTANDPAFHGVDLQGPVSIPIPKRFWKIVVARKDDALQAFAFVLEQNVSFLEAFSPDAEWRQRMMSLPDLEQMLGAIRFPDVLRAADQIDAAPGDALRAWTGLERA